VFSKLLARTGVLACAVVAAGCSVFAPAERGTARPPVVQIAYVGSDGHVYVAEADGGGARALSQSVAGLSGGPGWLFRWPTYSPDGRKVAFGGYRTERGELLSGAVLSADVTQTQVRATTLLESGTIGPVYLYWAPDSRHLSALVQRADSLVLYLLDSEAREQARELLVGNPLYWSWAPDGRSLAIHLGGDAHAGPDAWVGLLHLDERGPREERFAEGPGEFRAPAWSSDGRQLAYAVVDGEQSALIVRDATGQVRRVASSPTELAFTWAPGNDWLAFSSRLMDTPGVYQGLEVARTDGSERRRLSGEPLIAFYWAPDGSRLAYLRLDTRAQALSWHVVGVAGGASRALASFMPSDDFAFQLAFFDQYAQSTSIWSPDGRRLVYGTDASGQRRNGSTVSEHISVLDVDATNAQTRPAQVARGGLAVWSPATPR
jgi:TolB protein